MSPTAKRWRALGGVAGPAAFITAWAVLGTSRPRYSPVHDPISRLAAVDAPTRWPMTAGLLAFGLGVGLYATELRRVAGVPASLAAATTAGAAAGLAALPLESTLGGAPHAACAGVAYASLAAVPVLGGRMLARRGQHAAAALSVAAGVASGVALLASATAPNGTGLLQRVGLTIGDVWIMISAAVLAWPRRGDDAGLARAAGQS